MEAYFDNAATTVVFPEVRELVMKLMGEDYGNPSSLHRKGMDAGAYVKTAREIIAKELKAEPKEIIFTSGGTESNNMALIGAALANRRAGNKIVTTTVEHASVSACMKFLSELGFEVVSIGTDKNGIVDTRKLVEAVDENTILVSVMYVNNEIGSVMPIEEIGRLIKEKNSKVLFHVDAIQAFGKMMIYPKRLNIDMMSISGHKLHGPKGTGVLFVKNGTKLKPIIYGGGQQDGMRSGTENVPGIAGLGLAVKMVYENLDERVSHMKKLKDRLTTGLQDIENVYCHSGEAPHIASFSFVGVRSQVLLNKLGERGIYVSAGSACSSNKQLVSSVLTAIDLPKEQLESTLRFSFSEYNTEEQVDDAIEVMKEILPILRRYVRKK